MRGGMRASGAHLRWFNARARAAGGWDGGGKEVPHRYGEVGAEVAAWRLGEDEEHAARLSGARSW